VNAAPATPKPSPAPTSTAEVLRPDPRPRVTAAVLDLESGSTQPLLYGRDTAYDTASIVKVDVLAALLLQTQDAGRQLTARERTLAADMIRNSDNNATNVLWRKIGWAPGLREANKRLGLTSTTPGLNGRWGLTQTTASDQIRLLLAVEGRTATTSSDGSVLNARSRAYIKSLMGRVASDQAWGVSAATDSKWALKNGWLKRTATRLWDINSIGQITTNGHRCLIAVLSDGSASMSDGVALVERTAKQAVAAATVA
jgi:hypothetical protein